MSDLLVATRKGLFTLTRLAPGDWRIRNTDFLGDRVSLTLVDRRDHARYAAMDHGHFGIKLQRSTDGGATWTEVAAPAFPPRPDDVNDVNSQGQEVPWSVQLIWSMAAGGDDEPGTLWCGTIPGGLFRSTDRGGSWHLIDSLWLHPDRKEWFGGGYDHPGIHSICVDPRDSQRVVVAVSCGGVWQTRNRGETWTLCASGMVAGYMPPDRQNDPRIQDPHRMVQCAGQPEHFWVQHHSGVFRSTDDCASWHEITRVPPSSFGFAVAVHPSDPNTAFFVPAIKDERRVPVDGRLVVARTRDGGESFDVLDQGLPQEHAYDLIYRHALAIDASGDTLAFGSTTGSLWISEDQGASWSAASHHLPPIAAVEFAPAS
jgi:hypothetical protein